MRVNDPYFAINEFAFPSAEIIADLGAYTGDTTEEYLKRSQGFCTIYAFEPCVSKFKALQKRVKRLNEEWDIKSTLITTVPAGAGSETSTVKFIENDFLGSSVSKNEWDIATSEIQVYSLDDYFKDKKAPTIIKADIEGYELNMLAGAEEIIKSVKPKLAISIYHRASDIFEIPELIHNLRSDYQMAVRNHSTTFTETVLYCY
ncbi:MAG: FkbM family methyltransferase [Defluviitaleaceae bacterium]|nr:FkbM family methyltransferase [Defluviitaleaceae bacterium]